MELLGYAGRVGAGWMGRAGALGWVLGGLQAWGYRRPWRGVVVAVEVVGEIRHSVARLTTLHPGGTASALVTVARAHVLGHPCRVRQPLRRYPVRQLAQVL